jgi:hypothetical protein
MPSKLVVKIDGVGRGSIELNGLDISSSVRGMQLSSCADIATKVTLELAVSEIEITALEDRDATILVNLTNDVISALLALGWTQPEDDPRTYRVERRWELIDSPSLSEPPHAEEDQRPSLPAGCWCFELDHHRRYLWDGTHHERCPLYVIDNQSPDAHD